MPARSWKLSKWQLIQFQKFKTLNLTYPKVQTRQRLRSSPSESFSHSRISSDENCYLPKFVTKGEILQWASSRCCKPLPACQNLRAFKQRISPIWEHQQLVELTLAKKNEKGFYIKRVLLVDTLVNSTYIVCFLFETWLVCCSCIMFQAQKTIPRYHSVFRYGDFQDGFLPKHLRAGNILFGKCPFPSKPFFLYNPLPEMKI